jgi:hypothetical protein
MPPGDLREIFEQSRPTTALRGAYSYLRLVTNQRRTPLYQRIGLPRPPVRSPERLHRPHRPSGSLPPRLLTEGNIAELTWEYQ